MKPDCIVLDEPTAMLDPKGRREVLETVHKLNKEEGITIVFITHFMEEAVTADRVVVMKNGVKLHDGTPREIFSHVDTLKELGLDVPVASEIAFKLNAKGYEVGNSIINNEELAEGLKGSKLADQLVNSNHVVAKVEEVPASELPTDARGGGNLTNGDCIR